MSTSKETAGSDNRDLRAVLPGEPIESPVASTIAVSIFPPIPPTFVEDSHNELDNIGETIYGIEKKVYSSLVDGLSEMEDIRNACETCIMGDAGLEIEKIETAAKKITDKIKRGLEATSGAMHERLAQIGIFPPPMSEVLYRLKSGDIFGEDTIRNRPPIDGSGEATITGELETGRFPIQTETSSEREAGKVAEVDSGTDRSDNGTIRGDTGGNGSDEIGPIPPQPEIPIPGNRRCEDPTEVPPERCGPFDATEPGWTSQSNWTTNWNERFYQISGIILGRPIFRGTGVPPGPGACLWTFRDWHGGSGSPDENERVQFWLPDGFVPRTDCGTGAYQLVWGRRDLELHCRSAYALIHCPNGKPPVPPDGEPKPKPPADDCPPPPAEQCPPPPIPKGPKPPEKKEDICDMLTDIANILKLHKVGFDQLIRMGGNVGLTNPIAMAVAKALLGEDAAILPRLLDKFAKWATGVLEFATTGLNCDRGSLFPVVLLQSLLRIINHWFDIIPKQTTNILEQVSNTTCQSILPPGASADVAFLRGDITKDRWECWHKAEGHYLSEAEPVMMSARAKLDPSQIDKLFRREKLQQGEYDRLMREAGVMKDEDKRNIHNYNEAFPTASDAVTMLNRDVGDDVNVDWRKEDDLFNQGYKGRVQQYFEWNGYTRERALDQYRAHFHLPSYTMGMDFLHRFDDPDLPEEKRFDKEKFRKLLVRDDWSPAYIDWMIEAAYRPVTRSDTVKAYMIHAIDDDEFRKRFKQTGYNADTTEFYLNFYKKNREIQDRKRSGLPTLRTLVNQYARCEVTKDEFTNTVDQITTTNDQKKFASQAADLSRKVWERKQIINAIRGDYIVGMLDDAETIAYLQRERIDPSCISALLEQWQLARLRRSKRASAAQLCKWRWYGIITAEDQSKALVRIGWGENDAMRITAECTAYISEKAAKLAATAAEKAMREQRRRAAEAKKLLREIQCGPPDCPSNTPGGKRPKGAGPSNQGPSTNGKESNGPILK